LELLGALADLDGAQLAGPVVDVLEEMAMDGAEVGQIEGAAGNAPADTQNHEGSLLLVEKFRIGDPEPISQDRGAGIDVRVVRLAHNTREIGLRARM
jgi:hypothetical protein